MRVKAILLTLVLLVTFFVGCTKQPETTPPATNPPTTNEPTPPPQTTPPETTPDVTTTASIVNTEAAFEKAISSTGTWIIATLKDLTFTKDLTLDGEFKNGKKDDKGNDVVQRKIAPYTQDENRNVTGTFKITAPKLTINSPNAGFWYGTFKGDIYVNAKNFTLYGATVDGNVYFMSDEAKSTFKKDESKQPVKISGKEEMKK